MKKIILFVLGFLIAFSLDLFIGYSTQSYEWAGVPTLIYIFWFTAYLSGSSDKKNG